MENFARPSATAGPTTGSAPTAAKTSTDDRQPLHSLPNGPNPTGKFDYKKYENGEFHSDLSSVSLQGPCACAEVGVSMFQSYDLYLESGHICMLDC